jgi:hypothetical protein
VDAYASTLEGIGSFFGNRSIVFHFPNKTRITCASFEKVEGGADLPTTSSTSSAPSGIVTPAPSSTGSGNGTATTTATSSVATAAANGLRVGAAGAAVIGGAAFAFML